MDNLSGTKADYRSFAAAARNRHTWVLSFLYIGTFGSFIGYAVTFPTLLKNEFPEVGLSIAFAGALLGSLFRPLGGIMSDRWGGAVVTMGSFLVMGAGALGAVMGLRTHSFMLFLGSFLLLFVFTGIGNGSVYRMIPAVFRATSTDTSPDGLARSRRAAAGCIGIAGAIGAFGGFLIPRGFALSTSVAGTLVPALLVFVCVYALMLALTWAVYRRPGAALTSAGV